MVFFGYRFEVSVPWIFHFFVVLVLSFSFRVQNLPPPSHLQVYLFHHPLGTQMQGVVITFFVCYYKI